MADPRAALQGWSIEVRRERYRVVDGMTHREFHEGHYSGSWSEQDSKAAYKRIMAALEAQAASAPGEIARLSAPQGADETCGKCGAKRRQHCDLDEPGVDHPSDCDKMHHEFKPKTAPRGEAPPSPPEWADLAQRLTRAAHNLMSEWHGAEAGTLIRLALEAAQVLSPAPRPSLGASPQQEK